jgi:hypothetical protein
MANPSGTEDATCKSYLQVRSDGNELSDKVGQLKMSARDGKMRVTDDEGRPKQ